MPIASYDFWCKILWRATKSVGKLVSLALQFTQTEIREFDMTFRVK